MMKLFIEFLLVLWSIFSIVFIGYDIIVFLIERYSHFHIGRWNNIKDWEKSILKITKQWVIHTPTLRLKKECRYLLFDIINGSYGKTMVQSWQKAGCLLGIEELNEEEKRYIYKKVFDKLIDKDNKWKIKIDKIDYSMLAYAILKETKCPIEIKKAMDEILHCIENNLCEDGMISYSSGTKSSRRYVDTLGFVCPFLGLYGRVYNEDKYTQLAINQLKKFRENGFYRGLPNHCYQAKTNLPLGIYGWGRGIGWYTLALIDLYDELINEKDRKKIEFLILEIADECKKYQNDDGGFCSILQSGSVYDSSATAMLGYFFTKTGLIFQNSEYIKIAKKCRNKLMKVTKFDGVIDECQGDTIDIGIFSDKYGSMPFVQGISLRMSLLLSKNFKE